MCINFNEIEYPKEFAYFIGFVWSDGFINRNSYVVIEIIKDDGLNLFNIFSKVGEFKYSERKREGRQEQSTFFFNNKELANKYLTMFSEKARIDINAIKEWIPIIAGGELQKNPEEQSDKDFIDRIDYE